MCPRFAVVVVMAFSPDTLRTFIDTMPPSDFLSRFGCSCFIITCSTYSLLWKTIQDLPSCRLFPMSNMPCFTTPKQFYDTCHSHHRIGTSRKGNLSSFTKNNFEAKSLQLALTACWLAPIALNIWSYLRLPDACYLVVDLPCQSGTFTRWNNRPCSDAHPIGFESWYGNY